MKLKLTLLLFIISIGVQAQLIPTKIEDNLYGGKKNDELKAAVELDDHSVVLAGYTESKGYGNEDVWLIRVSADGKIMWERTFGGNKTDKAEAVALSSDNKILVAGFTESEGNGEKDEYILKVDTDGTLLWSKAYGTSYKDHAQHLIPNKQGGAIVTGYESAGGTPNVFLMELDQYGKIEWKKYYGGSGTQIGYHVAELPEGGYAIAGARSVNEGKTSQNWLIKTDKEGNKVSDKRFGSTTTLSRATRIIFAKDGGFYMAGNNLRTSGRRLLNKNWVTRFNAEGQEVWSKSFQQEKETRMNHMLALPDSSLMLTSVSSQGYSLIGKISLDGTVKWRTSYGKPQQDKIMYVGLLNNGHLLLAGSNESKSSGRKDGWVIELKDDDILQALQASKKPKKTAEKSKEEKEKKEKEEKPDKKFIDISLKPPKEPHTLVKEYVEEKIADWAKQGEFESTQAYNERVNLENRKEREQELSKEAMKKYGANVLTLNNAKLADNSYDPDAQTFLIKVPDSKDFRLHVPREEAPEFKKNWDNHKFTRVNYGLLEDQFVISSADVVVNYRTYRFNAEEDARYGDKMQQYVYSSETRSMFPTPYSAAVRYVKKNMDKFLQRGEFEAKTAYKERTSQENIRKKERKLSQEAFKMQAEKELDITNASLGRYNADKQQFPVNIPGSITFNVPVPIDEGRMFKENWDLYQFKNIAYGLHDGKYVIDSMQIIVKDSVYHFNSRKHASYGDEMTRRIDLDNIDYNKLDDKTYAMFFEGERPTDPPRLFITNININDEDNNGVLDAMENAKLKLTIRNNGKGKAYKTRLKVSEKNNIYGIDYDKEIEIGEIDAMSKKEIELPLKASDNLLAGQALFQFKVTEMRGNESNDKTFKLQTAEFKEPFLVVSEPYFATPKGGQIKLGESVYLKMLVENQGEGSARDVTIEFIKPANVVNAGKSKFNLGTLAAGETQAVNYEFIPQKTYSGNKIPIETIISEQYNKYGNASTVDASLDEELMPYTRYNLVADVDKNIPQIDTVYRNRYAVIIGNEDYQSYQEVGSEANVDYAAADAIVFKKYAENVLGIPGENIIFKVNARKHQMQRSFNQITELAKVSRNPAEIFFFYAGHGFPEEATKEAYIMPVNITGAEVQQGIKLADLYSQFSHSENVKRVTGFIDACFSGGGRAEGLLAARGIKVKPKEAKLQEGNLIVFSASSGDQVSLPYEEKNHGMFTYSLLKKLQESAGDINYGELKKHLERDVQERSRRVNNKNQNPSVNVSPSAQGLYSEWMINE